MKGRVAADRGREIEREVGVVEGMIRRERQPLGGRGLRVGIEADGFEHVGLTGQHTQTRRRGIRCDTPDDPGDVGCPAIVAGVGVEHEGLTACPCPEPIASGTDGLSCEVGLGERCARKRCQQMRRHDREVVCHLEELLRMTSGPPDDRGERIAHGDRVDAGKGSGVRRGHDGIGVQRERERHIFRPHGPTIVPSGRGVDGEGDRQRVGCPAPTGRQLRRESPISHGFDGGRGTCEHVEEQVHGLLALQRRHDGWNQRIGVGGCGDGQDAHRPFGRRRRVGTRHHEQRAGRHDRQPCHERGTDHRAGTCEATRLFSGVFHAQHRRREFDQRFMGPVRETLAMNPAPPCRHFSFRLLCRTT